MVRLETVRVAADTFRQLIFLDSVERREFTVKRMPNAQKPQKTSRAGIPLWSVKIAAVNWQDLASTFWVTVPSAVNPSVAFATGDSIALDDLVLGISPKSNGVGVATWRSAKALTPARSAPPGDQDERQLLGPSFNTWSATWWSV